MAKKSSSAKERPAKKAATKSTSRKARRQGNLVELIPGCSPEMNDVREEKQPRRRRLEFRTEAQYNYHQAIRNNILTFGLGPAGTGKSFIPTSMAAEALLNKDIQSIIITRPAVSAEEDIGFLPGTEDEKCAPYFAPIRDILSQWIPATHLEYLLKTKVIRFAPMGFLRGTTFDNAYILLDEAQNTTPKQMKLFLSRIGVNCKVIVTGDTDQVDIQGKSGLEDAVERLLKVSDVALFEFDEDDIVRSGIVKDIMKAYSSTKKLSIGKK